MIFLFHGNDSYSITQKVAHWKSEFEKKYPLGALHTVDVESWNDSEYALREHLERLIGHQTLFAQKKLVVIKHLFAHKEYRETIGSELLNRIPSVDDAEILVFVERVVDKRLNLSKRLLAINTLPSGECEEFTTPHGDELKKWIMGYAKKRNAFFEPDALETFMHRFEHVPWQRKQSASEDPIDLWAVALDVHKLIAYANGKHIEKKDVEFLIPRRNDAHVFDLVAALLARDKRAVARLLSLMDTKGKRDAKSDAIGVCTFLHAQCRDFAAVKDMAERSFSHEKIADALSWRRERVFVVSKNLSRISLRSLLDLCRTVVAMEAKLKSGSLDPTSVMASSLISWCS